VTGAGSSWVISGDLSIGTSGNGANILYVLDSALVQVGGAITIASNNYIYLADGYLAVAGDYTTGGAKNSSLDDLLSGMWIYAVGGYKAATTSNTYLVYITADIAAAYEAALGYDNLEGYTIFSSSLITVPEPATYALLGGLGALGLALYRRGKKTA